MDFKDIGILSLLYRSSNYRNLLLRQFLSQSARDISRFRIYALRDHGLRIHVSGGPLKILLRALNLFSLKLDRIYR